MIIHVGNPKELVFRQLQAGEHNHVLEGGTPQPHRDRAPVLGTLPGLTLCISSSGYSNASFIISFNKLVNVTFFPEFPVVVKNDTQGEGVMRTSNL